MLGNRLPAGAMTHGKANLPENRSRLRVSARGAVQGVGFRPYVFRLANDLGLAGWVKNTGAGAHIEVEGPRQQLTAFLLRLEAEKPARCFLQSLETTWLDPLGRTKFEILPSAEGPPSAIILPDLATCPECLDEVLDPANRRYRYPFTNCTNCGPRFSIIEALPYDRANTTMRGFRMCPQCLAEYEAPSDRRFHAQPNACPTCGPWLELWNPAGSVLCSKGPALLAAAEALQRGEILALKGIGGFQLLAAAHLDASITRLRARKLREEKPFALMFPTLEYVRQCCLVSDLEARLLISPEAPIVLLRRIEAATSMVDIAPSVAPGNPFLGVMLPYTPLHHLLLREVGFPVVATSGNVSDEPICIDERDALARLSSMADLFLVHNRPIVRHVDDSVARIAGGRELVLRRARGFAPLPIPLKESAPELSILAVGAHLKNAVALLRDSQVFVSQHIGDLETVRANDAFSAAAKDLTRLYDSTPGIIVADTHPDYASTRWAVERAASEPSTTLIQVQHHLAHVLSCMAENELPPPVLGVAWDGTGLGTDGTIWGGEFLLVTKDSWRRVAWLRPFPLPGGDLAIREPRRSALGLLFERFGEAAFDMAGLPPVAAFSHTELTVLRTMLTRRVNTPITSSMGRLFDAVAALLGLRQRSNFEGQAAMELEFAAHNALRPAAPTSALQLAQTEGAADPSKGADDSPLIKAGKAAFNLVPVDSPEGKAYIADWAPLLDYLLEARTKGHSTSMLAGEFHEAVADLAVQVARAAGESAVVLSGGCFQNALLLEQVPARLIAHGFKPYWHQRIPPNDGGICLGQIMAAVRNIPSNSATRTQSQNRS